MPQIREAIHHFELLDDGMLALLTSVRGNMKRYRDILAASPEGVDVGIEEIDEYHPMMTHLFTALRRVNGGGLERAIEK